MKTVHTTAMFLLLMSTFAAAENEWYIGGALGSGRVNGISTDKYDAQLLANQGITAKSSSKESDWAYKLFYGYKFNKNLAVEGNYASLGKPLSYTSNVTAPLTSAGERTETLKIRGWGVDAIGLLPLNKDLSLQGKAGLFYSRSELTVVGAGGYSASESEANPKFGLGFNFTVSPGLGLRAEWERFRKVGGKRVTGEGDAELWSAGLVYQLE